MIESALRWRLGAILAFVAFVTSACVGGSIATPMPRAASNSVNHIAGSSVMVPSGQLFGDTPSAPKVFYTKHSLAAQQASPNSVALGKDGSIWTESDVSILYPYSDSPVAIRLKNGTSTLYPSNFQTTGETLMFGSGIALTTANGTEWFAFAFGTANFPYNELFDVTPGSGTLQPGPSISNPSTSPTFKDMVLSPDGQIWAVAQVGGDNYGNPVPSTITIVTQTGHSRSIVFANANDSAQSVVAGPDGTMWVAVAVNGKLTQQAYYRYDLSGHYLNRIPLGTHQPARAVMGADGAIWFTDSTNSNIGRVSAAGALTTYALPANAFPGFVALGGDKAVWFAESDARIGRITTDGSITQYNLPSWVANPNQQIGQIIGVESGCRPDTLWFASNQSLIQLTIKNQ